MNQSGSASNQWPGSLRVRRHAVDPQDVGLARPGVRAARSWADAPVEALAGEQVGHRERGRQAEVGGHVDGALLRVVRVEVDDADDRVAAVLLDVGHQLVVLRVEPGDVREVLERRVLAPDLVDAAR